MWRHVACSWKNKDVGYCGVRGGALLGEKGGLNKKGSALENWGEHWNIVIIKKQMLRLMAPNLELQLPEVKQVKPQITPGILEQPEHK